MAIKARDAVAMARALLGTPYSELDCINLIKRVIRTAPGGVPWYTTAGTNTLWRSYEASGKYRDLTWRQAGIAGARAGMLAFKRSGEDVHHVGLATGEGTVIHSSSASGKVVETALCGSWHLLGMHRYIEVEANGEEETEMEVLYQAVVTTQHDPLRVRESPINGRIIGHMPKGATAQVIGNAGNGWLRIQYNGLEGYASGVYLMREEE